MKVFLDDERTTPDGWTRTWTAKETIELLRGGAVHELSLDHDLGDEETCGTGYDVLLWIEEAVAEDGFVPPKIKVHSANSGARPKMLMAVKSIEKLARQALPNDLCLPNISHRCPIIRADMSHLHDMA